MADLLKLLLEGKHIGTITRSLGILALVFYSQNAQNDLTIIKSELATIQVKVSDDHETLGKLEDVLFSRHHTERGTSNDYINRLN